MNRLGVPVKGDISGSVKVAGGAVRVSGPVRIMESDSPLIVRMNEPVSVEVTNPVEVTTSRLPLSVTYSGLSGLPVYVKGGRVSVDGTVDIMNLTPIPVALEKVSPLIRY